MTTTISERFDGRVALITGAARGIGLAIAEDLHARGAAVVIADNGCAVDGRGSDASLAGELATRLGERAAAFTDSIAEPAHAAAAVALARERFGGLDLVVNNAAILRDRFVFKGNPADWDAVIRTNLSAAYYVLCAATPVLRQQAEDGRLPGRIVNITASAGLYGNYGQSAYASAKAGLVGLTRVVAMDMQRSGVTCNAVVPFAATRVTELIQPANETQARYKARALKLSPRHVATVVVWLCSAAARHISGQLFGVRGREVLLFSQPRPLARLIRDEGDWALASLSRAAADEFADCYTDLASDLEAFDSEPPI